MQNQRIAKAIVAMKLIEKTDNGYQVNAPTFRGRDVYPKFFINAGKCTCLKFEEFADCEHCLAAEMMEAEAAKLQVAAANESCGCSLDWDSKFTNLCDRHEAAQAEAEKWERYEVQFGWAA